MALKLISGGLLEEPKNVVPEISKVAPKEPYQLPKVFGEDIAMGLVKGGARTLARLGESAVGFPGGIASLGLQAANYLTGGKVPTYEEIKKNNPELPLPDTPTEIRNNLKKVSKGGLEPESKNEAIIEETLSDIAALAFGKIPLKTALAKAGLGNLAAWGTEKLGFGPLAQTGAKVLTSFLAGLPGGRKVLEAQNNAAHIKGEVFGQNLSTVPTKTKTLAKEIFDKASEGVRTDTDKVLIETLTPFLNLIETGKVGLNNLWDQTKKLNNIIYTTGLSNEGKLKLGKIVHTLNEEIKEGAKKAPEFLKYFDEAKDLTRGLKSSSAIGQFLNKHTTFKGLMENPLTKVAMGYLAGTKLALGTIGLAITGREIAKTFELISKSSNARKYYKDTVQAMLNGDALLAAKNITKFDKIADNFTKKEENAKPTNNLRLISGGLI